jgi:hypothetical protein
MTDVVVDPVVGIKKWLYMLPGALDRVRMSTITLINETGRVIHSLVFVTVRFIVPVCRPAVIIIYFPSVDPYRITKSKWIWKSSHFRENKA